jgi:hypothetical protein
MILCSTWLPEAVIGQSRLALNPDCLEARSGWDLFSRSPISALKDKYCRLINSEFSHMISIEIYIIIPNDNDNRQIVGLNSLLMIIDFL